MYRYIPFHASFYNSDKELVETIGDVFYFMTISNPELPPETGRIWEGEEAKSLLLEWDNYMPNFQFSGGIRLLSKYNVFYPETATFRSVFPTVKFIPYRDGTFVLIGENGNIYTYSSSYYGQNVLKYESFESWKNGDDHIGILPADVIGINARSDSGSYRGSCVFFCPLQDGSGYRRVTIIGTNSTDNCLYVYDISDIEYNEDILTFLNTSATPDPYAQGGNSGIDGGQGTFDGIGDDVDIPDLPTLSAVETNFITLFNPSASELRNLADYMWGDLFDIGTWKKIFADPMDAILGLSIVPVSVPDGGVREITIGNISTGIAMNKAASQYVSVDCGSINVKEYWGAYLDYDPFTKAEIYLPYIGTHPISADDIMGKTVRVVYHVDILSGACCAYVKCGGSVLYSFVGQCSCSIPITGNDWTNVINGALSIAASIGSMVATGGVTAPMALSNIASTSVNSMKPSVEKSGSMGGMGGMLGIQTPYIILTRPRQALPYNQNSFTGYPSFITSKLINLIGYTEIDSVHLDGIPATEHEISEIESLLKGGVIL